MSSPLGRELRRVFPSRPFNVRFWDGGAVPATVGEAPSFFLRRPTALAHFLTAPGTLGLGRAYVDGSLSGDDLDRALRMVDRFDPPTLTLADRARLALATATAALPGGLPRRPDIELTPSGQLHSAERDAEVVRYHYDVGNEFFTL